MSTKCQGKNRDGSPCNAKPGASGWCVWHDPATRAKRAEWSASGGKNKRATVRAIKALPADVQDVSALILRSLAAVEDETMKPGQAQAIAALAGAYVRILDAGEQARRLDAIEEHIAHLPGRRRV